MRREEVMSEYIQKLLAGIDQKRDASVHETRKLIDRKRIVGILKEIQVILLPDFYHFQNYTVAEAAVHLRSDLEKEIRLALEMSERDDSAEELTLSFLNSLPDILELLNTDIQAIYDGDPAAKSKSEVILCYPGFYAISIYRIAHVLYELNIPLIPRIMTEYAHEKTGIDINPGAKIGDHFCIDHGTGIVIGETAVIGSNVKLYQGVTIGARSFEKDENGFPVKGGKRHPNIGNNVVIYANATILGGDTTIGDHSTIGGNVWILSSVPPYSKVYYNLQQG